MKNEGSEAQKMVSFVENRTYPDNKVVRLFEERDEKKQKNFVLKSCIEIGANSVVYRAEGDNGIPVKLKQFRPAGLLKDRKQFHLAEERFIEAYRQQLSMMGNIHTAAGTAGLYGLYRDDIGFWWTSISALASRTLNTFLLENPLQKNLKILYRVAERIKAFHEAGWILLDVKPENIVIFDGLDHDTVYFFNYDSFVQLSEIQKAVKEGHKLMLSSSGDYSAPELLEAEVDLAEIGYTADFYSVGALLFFAVFNCSPKLYDCLFDSEFDFSLFDDNKLLSAESRRAIESFLRHTLTLTSERRYETDQELLAALDKILTLMSSSVPQSSAII